MAESNADLPFTGQLKIVLPPLHPKAVPVMSEDEVNRIPVHLLNWLRSEASLVKDLCDITIITVSNEAHHLMIQQVVQWVTKGELAPFFVTDTPKVRNGDSGKPPVIYDPANHNNDYTLRATAKTHACFVEEADLYKFSVIAGLQDLQATLSKRLCSRYPVHVAEMTALFSTLYTKGIYTPFDLPLKRFICTPCWCLCA